MFRISVKTGSDSVPRLLLHSLRPTFKYNDNCREIIERLVEGNVTLFSVALANEALCWSLSDTESDLWMSYLNILGSGLPNSNPSCFIAQQLLLNIDYVILKILLQFVRV